MTPRLLAAMPLAIVALHANAATIRLTNPYGDLVDQGVTSAYIEASYPNVIDCTVAPDVQRVGNTFTIVARRVAPGSPVPQCVAPPQATLGELAIGWWQVVLRVIDAQGGTLIEELATEWRVHAPETLCNAYPVQSAVIATHRSMNGQQLASRIAGDAAYAALLGNPIGVRPFMTFPDAVLYYPQLDNPHDVRARLQASGEFASVFADGTACLATSPPDRYETAVEYYHAGLDHYFYTAYPEETAVLDSGSGVHGWLRTGKSFRVLLAPGCPVDRREQVAYRFFGKPGVGPSSHVFTVDRAECRIVDKSGAWIYEGIAFWATPANSSGGCSNSSEIPLYRLWRAFGDTNHRFTPERAIVDEMKGKGWVEEGVVMCVPR